MENEATAGEQSLNPDERSLLTALRSESLVDPDTLQQFFVWRERVDTKGKPYLGDLLVEEGSVDREVIERFFEQNNSLYVDFIDDLVIEGFLGRKQRTAIFEEPDAAVNVVGVVERLGIMTKESFTQHFSRRVNAFRLGDWLLTHKHVSRDALAMALAKQKIHSLEDYLRHHQIVDAEVLQRLRVKADTIGG